MTHERVECRLFPEAIPITAMEPGTLYLPVHIHRFPILGLSFQPFRAFQVGNTQEGDKNPETPQNPRGVKGYEEIRCHWIWVDTPYKIFFGNLPYSYFHVSSR